MCEDTSILEKFQALHQAGQVQLDASICMRPGPRGQDNLHSFEDLLRLGEQEGDDDQLDARMAGLSPSDTGQFIYTSGTTRVPKGAEPTHRGLTDLHQLPAPAAGRHDLLLRGHDQDQR